MKAVPLSCVKSEAEEEGDNPPGSFRTDEAGGASVSNKSNRSVDPRGLIAAKKKSSHQSIIQRLSNRINEIFNVTAYLS